jgi:hypothetical protein
MDPDRFGRCDGGRAGLRPGGWRGDAEAEAIYLPVEGVRYSFWFQTAEAQVALNAIEDYLAETFSAK